VQAFFGAFEAQHNAAEIGCIHGCVSAKESPYPLDRRVHWC
jgi:hypothetical protein